MSYNIKKDGETFHRLVYRRGEPQPDGNIIWTAEKTVPFAQSQANLPYVAVDSDGYPWIVYNGYSVAGGAMEFSLWVTKSCMINGTWKTADGFPFRLSPVEWGYYWMYQLVPLTGGKMVVVYHNIFSPSGCDYVCARRWTGEAWGPERATSSNVSGTMWFSAVADGDDVDVVFTNETRDLLASRFYYADDAWSPEQLVSMNGGEVARYPPLLVRDYDRSEEFCIWADANTGAFYYSENNAGIWGTKVNWFTETLSL